MTDIEEGDICEYKEDIVIGLVKVLSIKITEDSTTVILDPIQWYSPAYLKDKALNQFKAWFKHGYYGLCWRLSKNEEVL